MARQQDAKDRWISAMGYWHKASNEEDLEAKVAHLSMAIHELAKSMELREGWSDGPTESHGPSI